MRAHEGRNLADIIGSSHVAGKYCFTETDYLNEGADALLEMGSRVIKLWFTGRPKSDYPYHSAWPEVKSMIELAETPYFRSVFSKPFSTFVLETYPPDSRDGHYFTNGMTDEDAEIERQRFCDFARHLLTEYKGTGKTFIIQNWEGDWVLTNPEFTREVTDTAVKGMIDWLNARQEGVTRARDEVGMDGVTVAHAAEVNLVNRAMEGQRTVTNDVLPHTRCDLYSYSAYDSSLMGSDQFRKALDYLASKAPESDLFGRDNIFVGEFGAPENEFNQREVVQQTTETALDWGARYVIYWEVFCNEPHDRARDWTNDRPDLSDMRGFWLIRPDGTKSPAYEYFYELLRLQAIV